MWGAKEGKILKGCKPNIIQGSASHFGSSGKYYSFGARANYGRIEKSTLTQYVTKKFKSTERSLISKIDAHYMEKYGWKGTHTKYKILIKIDS